MKGHGAKSEAVRERVILALLSERTLELAAERAGVGLRTLQTWLAEDHAFNAALTSARQAAFQAGMGRIQALTGRAIETLEDLLGPEHPPAVRLGSARTITELGMHQHDAEIILRKLNEIETAQRQKER